MLKERFLELIDAMSGKRVAVVGDLVADEFLIGHTSRISREAPVLILKFQNRKMVPGGGANTINNIAALGGLPLAVGAVGGGDSGSELCGLLEKAGADTSGVIKLDDWRTIVKTRIMAGGDNTTLQQVIRIDKGDALPDDEQLSGKLVANVERAFSEADALLVSDYDGGVVCPAIIEQVNRLAAGSDKPITIDSHHRIPEFCGCTSYTPNEEEAVALIGDTIERLGVTEAGNRLLKITEGKSVLLTRGRFGMVLCRKGSNHMELPVYGSDEISDVTGAGDTVIATFTLALTAGADYEEATKLANIAAGIVVGKRGTATVSATEMKQSIKDYDFEKNSAT
jgi:D-glycero-beta-D-manno-heptose-7-phosphate kinase